MGNSLHSQRPRSLIDGVVHAADERIRNGSLIKADTGSVHFNKGRVFRKGRSLGLLGCFQHQPSGACFPHPRRAVDNHMLGILPAKNGLEGFDALLLAHNILERFRPHLLGQGLGKMHRPHAVELIHLPAALPASRRLRSALLLKLHIKEHARNHRYHQLDPQQHITCHPEAVEQGNADRCHQNAEDHINGDHTR